MNIEFAAITSRTAVARYVKQYGDGQYPQWKAVADKLRALPLDQHTPDIIAGIIGNKGWTHPHCGECSEYVSVAVTLGDGDYPVTVCLPCLKASASALAAAQAALATILPAAPKDGAQ